MYYGIRGFLTADSFYFLATTANLCYIQSVERSGTLSCEPQVRILGFFSLSGDYSYENGEEESLKRQMMRVLFGLMGALLLLGGCGHETAKVRPMTQLEQIEQIIKRMPVEEKVGQLVMGGLPGVIIDTDTEELITRNHFGGFVLFDRNLKAPEQVRALTSALMRRNEEVQREIDPHHPALPLFIGIDEEGGQVVSFHDHLVPPPSEESLGKDEEPAKARVWAVKTAKALRSYGINLNFAPVLDLGLAPERSYSNDPAKVAMFGSAAAAGYAQEHFSFVVKHFPGIGKGKVDTHIGGTVVDTPIEKLAAEDILPFRNVLSGQFGGNCGVMVGHVTYAGIDKDRPASVSPAVITGELRHKLAFDGVVFTDDIEMGAVAKKYDYETAAVMAIEAGADVVLVCHEYEHMEQAYQGLMNAVAEGRISQERLDASLRRIVRMKLSAHY